MADKEDVDKASKEEAGPAGPSVMGPLLALIGVFLIGVVLIFGIIKVLNTTPEETGEKTAGTLDQQKPLLDRAAPLPLGDVMVNVMGEQGRRYVKVTVELWYPMKMKANIEKPEIRNRIVQAAEQRLATFDMQELNSEFIHATMARAFMDQINKELRMVYGTVGTDTVYVEDVVLTNLLVQ